MKVHTGKISWSCPFLVVNDRSPTLLQFPTVGMSSLLVAACEANHIREAVAPASMKQHASRGFHANDHSRAGLGCTASAAGRSTAEAPTHRDARGRRRVLPSEETRLRDGGAQLSFA